MREIWGKAECLDFGGRLVVDFGVWFWTYNDIIMLYVGRRTKSLGEWQLFCDVTISVDCVGELCYCWGSYQFFSQTGGVTKQQYSEGRDVVASWMVYQNYFTFIVEK